MTFALGQRWISETESDLGLGTIVAQEGRMLTVLFPASGETRQYAQQQAPLTRVRFNPGDTVKSAEGYTLTVSAIQEQHQTLVYCGPRDDTGEYTELRETFLDHFLSFNQPQDRLFAGQIDRSDWFSLRYQSWQHLNRQQQSTLQGLTGARVSLIPHQLHIAQEVASRYAPRVLLADEVGLGKTIEAGLIIHQQLISGLASRVLIVVPESLQHQWLVEMLRRFNLRFSIFDEERCQQAQLDDDNPFETAQLVLCSLEWLTAEPQWQQAAAKSQWDLLVVDEAHHLQWHPEHPSAEYQCVEQLAADTSGLILLTATPDQLGHQSHFARLRLLDPDRFHDYQKFLDEEQHYQHTAALASALLSEQPITAEIASALQTALTETNISAYLAMLQQSTTQSTEQQNARQHLISQLLDRHGTGRILFRNSRSSIKGFPLRQLHPAPLPMPEQYLNALKVHKTLGTDNELTTQAFLNLCPEQVFRQFAADNNSWWQFDPRVDHLLQQLKQYKPAKFLVICAKAETAIALEEAIRTKEGIRAAVFHEGMTILERDKAAAYFAQEQYSAQVLICSEIGSEGRNFQFAHHLVLFDLPLNPDLLEQRIGRLDRIGQQQDIQIHLPYFSQHSQEILWQWYSQGLNALQQTCQTGRAVYEQLQQPLLELLANPEQAAESFPALLNQAAALSTQLRQQLEKGRDKLLEINSNGGDNARTLAANIAAQDADIQLPTLMFSAWDQLGVHQEDRSDTCIILTPSEHLRCSYPGLEDEGVTITFDRKTALAQEDVQLLTWDHPMVRGTLDILTNEQMGNSAVALLPNKALPAGSYFVEFIFIAEASAPAWLQLNRYLPVTPIRLLLEKTGKDLAEKVPFTHFNNQLKPVGRQPASKLAGALQQAIHPLIAKAGEFAEQQLIKIKQQAIEKMQHTLTAESERLQALRRFNPSVRQQEIDHLVNQQQQLQDYLNKARLKLDAIRLIVVSHD